MLSSMADYWSQHGVEVDLITLSDVEEDFFEISPAVRRVGLDCAGASRHLLAALRNNLRRVSRLRQVLSRAHADIVISFGDRTNVLTLLATWGQSCPVIVSERVDPRQLSIGIVWRVLRRLVYPIADALVVQTNAVAVEWASGVTSAAAVRVIPNFVRVPPLPKSSAAERIASQFVLGVGRLTRQKGFDLLLRAFERASRSQPLWSLVIAGDGPERGALEILALELGIGQRVRFLGVVRSIASVLAQTGIFVLSSRFEGFPNALLEAMAAGVAVVSFDCPSGPRDIIRPGVDGVLVPPQDVDSLAKSLEELMRDPQRRQRLAEGAMSVVCRFSEDQVMAAWNEVIQLCRDHSRDARGT
jgi:glycosyltransferase involved in cell wall biosynthesis